MQASGTAPSNICAGLRCRSHWRTPSCCGRASSTPQRSALHDFALLFCVAARAASCARIRRDSVLLRLPRDSPPADTAELTDDVERAATQRSQRSAQRGGRSARRRQRRPWSDAVAPGAVAGSAATAQLSLVARRLSPSLWFACWEWSCSYTVGRLLASCPAIPTVASLGSL